MQQKPKSLERNSVIAGIYSSKRALLSVTGAYLFSACAAATPPSFPPHLLGWVQVQLPAAPIDLWKPAVFAPAYRVPCYEAPLPSGAGSALGPLFFCVEVWPVAGVDSLPKRLSNGLEPNCTADCRSYEDVQGQATTLGANPAFVQTALVSGGFSADRQAPVLHAWVDVGSEWVVFFSGQGRVDADIDRLLQVAATLTLR